MSSEVSMGGHQASNFGQNAWDVGWTIMKDLHDRGYRFGSGDLQEGDMLDRIGPIGKNGRPFIIGTEKQTTNGVHSTWIMQTDIFKYHAPGDSTRMGNSRLSSQYAISTDANYWNGSSTIVHGLPQIQFRKITDDYAFGGGWLMTSHKANDTATNIQRTRSTIFFQCPYTGTLNVQLELGGTHGLDTSLADQEICWIVHWAIGDVAALGYTNTQLKSYWAAEVLTGPTQRSTIIGPYNVPEDTGSNISYSASASFSVTAGDILEFTQDADDTSAYGSTLWNSLIRYTDDGTGGHGWRENLSLKKMIDNAEMNTAVGFAEDAALSRLDNIRQKAYGRVTDTTADTLGGASGNGSFEITINHGSGYYQVLLARQYGDTVYYSSSINDNIPVSQQGWKTVTGDGSTYQWTGLTGGNYVILIYDLGTGTLMPSSNLNNSNSINLESWFDYV